jgi:signal transduction histidine kinase
VAGVGSETFEVPLWRALAIFRIAALGYAALRLATYFRAYAHPALGGVVVAVMAGWTAVTIFGYERTRLPRWPLLATDLAVTVCCLLVSPPIIGAAAGRLGIANNLPVAWMASPVLAWGISGGRRRGAVAALVLDAALLTTIGNVSEATVDSPVLLLLVGVTIGHVARLNVEARERLQRATELEAANRERERLARDIHDSVLQVLALVQRRGAEAGGEAAELGRLAGEQEAALRSLVGTAPAGPEGPDRDLRTVLAEHASTAVSLATPAHPVRLPTGLAGELSLAVAAALSNVRQHCGPDARAWVLVEVEDGCVAVTVRDDGPGIPPGRLDEAAAAGRLGVAQSIRGRVRELGGTVMIISSRSQGTEVELRVPV